MKYSEDAVDAAVKKILLAQVKIGENKTSAVRLRAAERDFLTQAKNLKEIISSCLGDGPEGEVFDLFDKDSRLSQLEGMSTGLALSDANCKNPAWLDLKGEIEKLSALGSKLGGSRPKVAKASAPESIEYETLNVDKCKMEEEEAGAGAFTLADGTKCVRLTPGKAYEFKPTIKGGSGTLTFTSVGPALPQGLQLQPHTGIICGTPTTGMLAPKTTYTVIVTNDIGKAQVEVTFAVQPPPPWMLAYVGLPTEFYTGDELTLHPTSLGGQPTKYSVDPPLPPGFELDARTGAIAGIPMLGAPENTYTIKAENDTGSCTATAKFVVHVSPPISLEYPEASGQIPLGSTIYLVPDVELKRVGSERNKGVKWGRFFSNTGAFVGQKWGKVKEAGPIGTVISIHDLPELDFSITPDLPEGLSMAQRTGVISGKPSTDVPPTPFRVTVKNEGGTISATITLGFRSSGPKSLRYPDVPPILSAGVAISIEPEVMGVADQWEVDPPLPTGMKLDPVTGSIMGAPTASVGQNTYVVKCKNESGEATAKVTFEVKKSEPKNLVYRNLEMQYPVGRKMEVRPTVDGEVTSFKSDPDLPAGLSLDPASGLLSGTPTEVAENLMFKITAENESGSCCATIAFSIQVLEPEDLSYPTIDDEYNVGEHIYLEPEITGGATSWTVQPDLPEGLELEETTGIIQGSPTEECDECTYIVLAENEAGTTSTVLTFAVTSRAPKGLRYPQASSEGSSSSIVLTQGQDVCLEPELDQTNGALFSISPALEGGLSMNEETGEIHGVPADPFDSKEFTITAKNFAGETSMKLWISCRPGVAMNNLPAAGEAAAPAAGIVAGPPPPGTQVTAIATGPNGTITITAPTAEAAAAAAAAAAGAAGVGPVQVQIVYVQTAAGGAQDPAVVAAQAAANAQKEAINKAGAFASEMESTTKVDDLTASDPRSEEEKAAKITKAMSIKESLKYMLWVVHRLHLNDPTLTDVDFSCVEIPAPHLEPRIGPKLMKALKTNEHCKKLNLSLTSLRSGQADELCEALKLNKALESLDISNNLLASDRIISLANAIKSNADSALCDLKVAYQNGVDALGRAVEKALAELVENNKKITTLACSFEDAHWRGQKDKFLMRNKDEVRRQRKKEAGMTDTVQVVYKELKTLKLLGAVDKAAWEVFENDEGSDFSLCRLFVAKHARLPSQDDLQKFSQANSKPFKYAEVGPLLQDFQKFLFDAHKGLQVMCEDDKNKPTTGSMTAWTQMNGRFTLDVAGAENTKYQFVGKPLFVMVDAAIQEWITPQEDS